MTIQEIREQGHPEIAELAEIRKSEHFERYQDSRYDFYWLDTKEGSEFWSLVTERSYKEAYKIVPLEKIKKRIMKGKKKDRLKQTCYEICDEYFNDEEKVKGIREKIFEKPELEENKKEPDATIHLDGNGGGVIYAKKPGFWGVVGNPDATVNYYDQRLIHPLKEEENKESLKKYKNGDDYAKNVTEVGINPEGDYYERRLVHPLKEVDTIKLKYEGVVEPPLPESMEEYLDTKGLTQTFNGMSKYSKQLILLDQLLDIRDIYRQGWKPGFLGFKYNIIYYNGNISISNMQFNNEMFSFQSEEVRDKFLENFRKELEEVKELWT